ncbi:MAG: methyl-accepting chemotaxis protein, partial [Holophagales bacterium]|nr:methyl-accepting chemotaxis protein [Holophagales bacterium]
PSEPAPPRVAESAAEGFETAAVHPPPESQPYDSGVFVPEPEPMSDAREPLPGATPQTASSQSAPEPAEAVGGSAEATPPPGLGMFEQSSFAPPPTTFTPPPATSGGFDEILELVRAYAAGDLDRRALVTPDAAGDVVQVLHGMAEGLARTLDEIREVADTLLDEANSLAGEGSRTTVGGPVAAEAASSSRAVAELAERSAAGARRAADAVSRGLEAAEAGRGALSGSLDGLRGLRQVAGSLAERLGGVGERAMEIAELTDVLSQVATQTHLLSLNAAIEASSAGQDGVRFAVIAQEMRQLAAEVGGVSKRLAEGFQTLRSEAREALDAMEESSQSVTDGLQATGDAEARLDEAVSLATDASAVASEIAATAEQASGRARGLTASLSALTEATEAATGPGAPRERAARLRRLAEEQRQAVGRFRPPTLEEPTPPLTGLGPGPNPGDPPPAGETP